MSIEIITERVNRVYRPHDKVKGTIIVKTDSGFAHSGITLNLTGVVDLYLNAKTVGLFGSFSNNLKSISLCDFTHAIEETGKTKTGINEYPFVFDLVPPEDGKLYETYHGVFINITYVLKANLFRKFFGSNLKSQLEFKVEQNPVKEKPPIKPIHFVLGVHSVDAKVNVNKIPPFTICGVITNVNMTITEPFWGHLVVEECEIPIKSVDLQILRVETVGSADGFSKEDTEIQNIQVIEGNVIRGIEIPLYMVYPRLYTCPSTLARSFKIEFQVSIMIIFVNGCIISKKFPINLFR